MNHFEWKLSFLEISKSIRKVNLNVMFSKDLELLIASLSCESRIYQVSECLEKTCINKRNLTLTSDINDYFEGHKRENRRDVLPSEGPCAWCEYRWDRMMNVLHKCDRNQSTGWKVTSGLYLEVNGIVR